MSQPATSAGVAARPIPSLRSPALADAAASSAQARSAVALGYFDILDLTVALHEPGLDAVVVVDRVDAADFAQLRLGRLHITGLVDRARLQQQLAAGPVGLGVEAHARLVEHEA